MKLFYVPSNKSIIAKSKGKFYSLPNAEEISKPETIIPCQPFLKENKSSNWCEIPDDVFYEFLNQFNDLSTKDRRPKVIKIHKIRMAVIYTINEVGEPWFQLYGNVPHYVLNGIANILKEEFYNSAEQYETKI